MEIVHENVQRAEANLKELEERRDISGREEHLIAFNKAQAEYIQSLAKEDAFIKQCSRIKWLKEGDSNTHLLYASWAEKRVQLTITRIKSSSGSWLDQPGEIAQEAVDFLNHYSLTILMGRCKLETNCLI